MPCFECRNADICAKRLELINEYTEDKEYGFHKFQMNY